MMKRIAWLDSCKMPSRIHVTGDDGKTTVCGHIPFENKGGYYWEITDLVPRKIHGTSRYCKTCFKIAKCKKSIPFFGK